jgi:hypothetical protein
MRKEFAMRFNLSHNSAPRATHSRRVGLAALVAAFTFLSVGCGGKEGPGRMGVRGAVQFDNAPLASGRILFVPEPPTQGPVASAVIVDGAYQIPAEQGVVAGKHSVQIEGTINLGFPIDDEEAYARRGGAPLPPNPVPLRYNRRSTLKAEVAPDGEQTFDFQLTSADTAP